MRYPPICAEILTLAPPLMLRLMEHSATWGSNRQRPASAGCQFQFHQPDRRVLHLVFLAGAGAVSSHALRLLGYEPGRVIGCSRNGRYIPLKQRNCLRVREFF